MWYADSYCDLVIPVFSLAAFQWTYLNNKHHSPGTSIEKAKCRDLIRDH